MFESFWKPTCWYWQVMSVWCCPHAVELKLANITGVVELKRTNTVLSLCSTQREITLCDCLVSPRSCTGKQRKHIHAFRVCYNNQTDFHRRKSAETHSSSMYTSSYVEEF